MTKLTSATSRRTLKSIKTSVFLKMGFELYAEGVAKNTDALDILKKRFSALSDWRKRDTWLEAEAALNNEAQAEPVAEEINSLDTLPDHSVSPVILGYLQKYAAQDMAAARKYGDYGLTRTRLGLVNINYTAEGKIYTLTVMGSLTATGIREPEVIYQGRAKGAKAAIMKLTEVQLDHEAELMETQRAIDSFRTHGQAEEWARNRIEWAMCPERAYVKRCGVDPSHVCLTENAGILAERAGSQSDDGVTLTQALTFMHSFPSLVNLHMDRGLWTAEDDQGTRYMVNRHNYDQAEGEGDLRALGVTAAAVA